MTTPSKKPANRCHWTEKQTVALLNAVVELYTPKYKSLKKSKDDFYKVLAGHLTHENFPDAISKDDPSRSVESIRKKLKKEESLCNQYLVSTNKTGGGTAKKPPLHDLRF